MTHVVASTRATTLAYTPTAVGATDALGVVPVAARVDLFAARGTTHVAAASTSLAHVLAVFRSFWKTASDFPEALKNSAVLGHRGSHGECLSCDGAFSKGEGVTGRDDGKSTCPHRPGVSIFRCVRSERNGGEKVARGCCLGTESSGCTATAPRGKRGFSNRRAHGEDVAEMGDKGRSPGRVLGRATVAQTAGACGWSTWCVRVERLARLGPHRRVAVAGTKQTGNVGWVVSRVRADEGDAPAGSLQRHCRT